MLLCLFEVSLFNECLLMFVLLILNYINRVAVELNAIDDLDLVSKGLSSLLSEYFCFNCLSNLRSFLKYETGLTCEIVLDLSINGTV